MNFINRARQSFLGRSLASTHRRWLRVIGTGALTIVFILNMLPDEMGFAQIHGAAAQAANPLTFTPDADAYVKQGSPTTNYGTAASLQVNGVSNPDIETFIRFTVTGVSETIQSARLR